SSGRPYGPSPKAPNGRCRTRSSPAPGTARVRRFRGPATRAALPAGGPERSPGARGGRRRALRRGRPAGCAPGRGGRGRGRRCARTSGTPPPARGRRPPDEERGFRSLLLLPAVAAEQRDESDVLAFAPAHLAAGR